MMLKAKYFTFLLINPSRFNMGSEKVSSFFGHKNHLGVFLSNFSDHPIVYNRQIFPTSEHLYQSLKFTDSEVNYGYAEIVRTAKTPYISKILAGQKLLYRYDWQKALNPIISEWKAKGATLRDDWNDVKDKIMVMVLWYKVMQHIDVKMALLSTGDNYIVEASPYDYYWGEGRDGTGENKLGKAWMFIREVIRENEK